MNATLSNNVTIMMRQPKKEKSQIIHLDFSGKTNYKPSLMSFLNQNDGFLSCPKGNCFKKKKIEKHNQNQKP